MVGKVESLLCFGKGETFFKMVKKLEDLCFSVGGLKIYLARMKITLQKGAKVEPCFVSVKVVNNHHPLFL